MNYSYTCSILASWLQVVGIALILSSQCLAAIKTESEIVHELLTMHLGHADAMLQQQGLSSAREVVRDLGQRYPDDTTIGVVVLSRAFDATELIKLVEHNELTLYGTEAKTAVGNRGVVFTTIIGDVDLYEGTLTERFEFFANRHRDQLAMQRKWVSCYRDNPLPRLDQAEFDEYASRDLEFFKITAGGTFAAFHTLQQRTDVSLIMLQEAVSGPHVGVPIRVQKGRVKKPPGQTDIPQLLSLIETSKGCQSE